MKTCEENCIHFEVCTFKDGDTPAMCNDFIDKSKIVKIGEWLPDGRCSECGVNPLTTHKNYCPNCGVRMIR